MQIIRGMSGLIGGCDKAQKFNIQFQLRVMIDMYKERAQKKNMQIYNYELLVTLVLSSLLIRNLNYELIVKK